MKIVVNSCYGQFQLSRYAWEQYANALNVPVANQWVEYENRTCSILVSLIEKLGGEANGAGSVVEIPDNIEFTIESNKGREWIAATTNTWR